MHNWRRGKVSEYGQRLREKQKVKRYYGVYERHFKNYYQLALRMPGNTGETLLVLLESRLDNVISRGGFAYSHAQGRQFIQHGHILVNGKEVNIPSYRVKAGDIITPHGESSEKIIKPIYESKTEVPTWLERSTGKPELKVVNLPTRSEVVLPIEEQLIVDFCSR
jgi:small subunit ribosomal protein S4